MTKSPQKILQSALDSAKRQSVTDLEKKLSPETIADVRVIVENVETQKSVLTVTLTSIAYKVIEPSQDVRYHQDSLPGGYSGRTFDTKIITPFIDRNFHRLSMAESGWLTRSLEQPHPYDLNYPGHIHNKRLKQAFLDLLDRVEKEKNLAEKLLPLFFRLMLDKIAQDEDLLTKLEPSSEPSISNIVQAVRDHLYRGYSLRGASRLPVLVIYAVYQLLIQDVSRFQDKLLGHLESHTSADLRSKSLGDIQILNEDKSVFEAIEIKHMKPITVGIVNTAHQKIKHSKVVRYYILTTNDPNLEDEDDVIARIEELRLIHPCQIVVNGVLPGSILNCV